MKPPPTRQRDELFQGSPSEVQGTTQPDERRHQTNTTPESCERKAGKLIQALCRVVLEFEVLASYRPYNLMLMKKRLTNGFWRRTDTGFLEDIDPILKGYFIWSSHIVQPTVAELKLLEGLPAVRSERLCDDECIPWAPPVRLDGTPSWTEEPHVVKLGKEAFSVGYGLHYAEPLGKNGNRRACLMKRTRKTS